LPADRAVYVMHDLIPLHFPKFVDEPVVRAFVDNVASIAFGPHYESAKFVTASRSAGDDIASLFRSMTRREIDIDVVDWGLDAKTFFPEADPNFRKRHRIPEDALVVVAVSSQDPRKRFSDIRIAVESLDAYAVFIGKGTPRREGNAIFLGHVPDADVRRAYSSCDLVVNWSAAEGFGLPVIEALACGARVVVPPDNPVLMEIGGEHVTVAPTATCAGLRRGIELAINSPRPTHIDFKRFDWSQSARVLESLIWPSTDECRVAA